MMSSQAATVDSLIKKGKFEPQVAMAIAEAIDNAMSDSQLVTVPILDARFADHRAEIRGDLLRLENKIDSVSAALDKKIDVSFATLAGKMDVSVAKLGELNERTKAELVRWVFVTMVGSVVGTIVALFNALQHH
jgi:hypothetical protein